MPVLVQELAHPAFDHGHACPQQIATQGTVERWAVEQVFLIQSQMLAIPEHLALRQAHRLAQRPAQTGMAQPLQHPLGDPSTAAKRRQSETTVTA